MNNTSPAAFTVDEISLMLQNDKPTLNGPVECNGCRRYGNAFVIMGACTNVIRRHLRETVQKASIDAFVNQFLDKCTEGDYNELLLACTKYVTFNL